MKDLKMYIRTVEGEKQINCIGYFNCQFFSLEDLLRHQQNIYDLIISKKKNKEDVTELSTWYDVTEYMRVKLLD